MPSYTVGGPYVTLRGDVVETVSIGIGGPEVSWDVDFTTGSTVPSAPGEAIGSAFPLWFCIRSSS